MFQTVRHWWDSGRGKVTGRLFAFEFFVVLLGVLTAQMLQNWAAERRSRSDARWAVERLRLEAADARAIADYWRVIGPCLVNHVRDIAVAASQQKSMSAREIGRPALPTPEFSRWDEATLLAVRRAYGDEVATTHENLVQQAEITTAFNQAIAQDWANFGLADASLGTPMPSDWANVRLAAVQVRTHIRIEQIKAEETIVMADRLGIRRSRPFDSLSVEARVDRCGLLKNW